MSAISTLTELAPALRWMVHLDLPQVVRISQHGGGLQWNQEDFLSSLRSINTVGHIAEIGTGLVGFLVYRVLREEDLADTDKVQQFKSRFSGNLNAPPAHPLQIELLNIGVTPELHRQGIGRRMLKKLDLKIQREGGRISGFIPETNLDAQLFLRAAGFKATGVVRRYFGDTDAYQMERWC